MDYFNYESWPRRAQFEFFSTLSDPFYSVSFELDVSRLYDFSKREDVSFYYSLTWLVTRALNSVDAFMYGMKTGRVIRYDHRIPSFTDLRKGSEAFHIVTMEAGDDLISFCKTAKEKSLAQKSFLEQGSEGDQLIYISCLPWVPMTGFVTERDFNRDDSIPRVTWGKYQKRGDALILNMSLDLNHRFIDGLHIGQFYERLTELIGDL